MAKNIDKSREIKYAEPTRQFSIYTVLI